MELGPPIVKAIPLPREVEEAMANSHALAPEDPMMTLLHESLAKHELARLEKEFKDWCDWLESIPQDQPPMLKNGLKADIELQPQKWLSAGIDLLSSGTSMTQTQHFDGRKEPLNAYLLYPAFQMGTEIFLKGMLLCQYEECRLLRDNVYMDKGKRDKYGKGLFKLRHDLLKIIVAVREIPKYQNDSNSMKFLRRLEGIIREFHYPLYEAEISKSWSGARYPKRFYNDTTQVAKSDSMSKFPPHRIVKKLFDDMEMHVDHLWGMTENLLSESAVDRGKGKL